MGSRTTWEANHRSVYSSAVLDKAVLGGPLLAVTVREGDVRHRGTDFARFAFISFCNGSFHFAVRKVGIDEWPRETGYAPRGPL